MDGDISAIVKNQLCRRLEFAEVVPSIEPVDKKNSKQDKGPSEIDSYTNYATFVHANLSDEIIPRVGMEFDTEGDVYDFYNKYAKEVLKHAADVWTKEAKIGVTINSSMFTRSNDPKVDVGSRYKTLLRWYYHLATRAK
ncbi:hypothetical protein GQ457_14G018150 [Hibiscus cannabinus]